MRWQNRVGTKLFFFFVCLFCFFVCKTFASKTLAKQMNLTSHGTILKLYIRKSQWRRCFVMKGCFLLVRYERTMALKTRNPALKIILAVGGYNMASLPFVNIVRNSASRSSFAQSAVAFLRQRNFDGLDVDWEYPAQRGSAAADKRNFVLLMQVPW